MADLTTYILGLFSSWLGLFAAPFTKGNFDILWIIVPIYVSWFLSEYYQEKRGTSKGNAISNGFVGLWVGVDWARKLSVEFAPTPAFLGKAAIALFIMIYGFVIIYEGVKGRDVVKAIGRVKETSYIMVMFSPIVYGLSPLTIDAIIAILLFFPVVYGITELVDRLVPTPNEEAVKTAHARIPPQTASATTEEQPAAPETNQPGAENEEKRPGHPA